MYNVTLTITSDSGEKIELQIDTSCEDCNKAIELLVSENNNPKRTSDNIFSRKPIMLLVDPDYNNTIHFESMNTTIRDYRKLMTKPERSEIVKWATDNLSHYVIGDGKDRFEFVKKLREHYTRNGIHVELKEAVDIFNAIYYKQF